MRVTILRTSTVAAERFNAYCFAGVWVIVAIVTCTAIIVIGSIRRMIVAVGMRVVAVTPV